MVIKLGKANKNKLSTYVVAAGLVFGCGENVFHFLFKEAWHNAQLLPIFGDGMNAFDGAMFINAQSGPCLECCLIILSIGIGPLWHFAIETMLHVTYKINRGCYYNVVRRKCNLLKVKHCSPHKYYHRFLIAGSNIVPTVHVSDLAQIIHNVIDQKPKTRYIVAVDESQSTLEEIVKAVRFACQPACVCLKLTFSCLFLNLMHVLTYFFQRTAIMYLRFVSCQKCLFICLSKMSDVLCHFASLYRNFQNSCLMFVKMPSSLIDGVKV